MYTKHFHETCLLNKSIIFIHICPGKGQILWTFQKKNVVHSHQAQKRPIFISTIFFHHFFSLLTYTNPSTLRGANQCVRALLL